MDFRPLDLKEREELRGALRDNGAGETAILVNRRDTSFAGVGNVDPDAEVIDAVKSTPTHYALPRRSFLAGIGASITWWLFGYDSVRGAQLSETKNVRLPSEPYKRIFRRLPKGRWLEIKWQEMRPGEEVLCLSFFCSVLVDIERWTVVKHEPDHVWRDRPISCVQVTNAVSLLPS